MAEFGYIQNFIAQNPQQYEDYLSGNIGDPNHPFVKRFKVFLTNFYNKDDVVLAMVYTMLYTLNEMNNEDPYWYSRNVHNTLADVVEIDFDVDGGDEIVTMAESKVGINLSSQRDIHTGLKEFCPVCQEDIVRGDEVLVGVRDCTHRFHRDCAEEWGQPTCPTCRGAFYF